MARKTRLHIVGGLYHAALRGNGGQQIFFEDEDRERAHHLLEARARAAVLAVETQAVTLTELSRRFNRDVATLSNEAKQLRERISKNADLADRLAQMQRELMQTAKA